MTPHSLHAPPLAVPLHRAPGDEPARRTGVRHHFTVDVEEFFQVSALEPHVPRAAWGSMESRIEDSMALLLDLLERREAKATCFILGWIAARHPELVREIALGGHEIASHGWDHRKVTHQTPEEFRESVRSAKRRLEDLTGVEVIGFRAPSFSIVPGREWALDILLEEGYRYDSSLFPIRRPGYGYPGAASVPHWLRRSAGRLAEFPPATLRRAGVNLPAGGGAYFRLLPYRFVRTALREWERQGVGATFYIHPWEWDPGQPRLSVPLRTRIRHYGGLGRTWTRIERLLAEFHFTTVARTMHSMEQEPIDAGRHRP